MGREEAAITAVLVSMKSGLRDRNNSVSWSHDSACGHIVSMKSGLRDRNNVEGDLTGFLLSEGLNEVRSRRPEQCVGLRPSGDGPRVSMKSGLGDRNNAVGQVYLRWPRLLSQ